MTRNSDPPLPPEDDELETQPVLNGPGLAVGFRLKERYRIEGPLGRGAMGIVYVARDEELADRTVVVKVLPEHHARDERHLKKFHDQMRALARLQHPNIVAALDYGLLPDNRPFLVMEHVSGRTLAQRRDAGRLSTREVAAILLQAGRALTVAHAQGICHGDLKPQNIMIQDLGGGEQQAKIIDFGVATVWDPQEGTRQLTSVGGTPAYMAPEHRSGWLKPASDTYALAVIGFELLTGQHPFGHKPGTPPSALRPDLPASCDAAILRGMALDPEDRQASTREFAEALAAALSDSPIATLPDDAREEAGGPPPGRWRLPGALLGLGLLVSVAAFLPSLGRRPASTTLPSPERTLSYSLLLKDGASAASEPVRVVENRTFRAGDVVFLELRSPQSGFLYVVNQGPESRSGLPSYNLLFPSSEIGGAPALPASRDVRLGPYNFDAESGTERLWLIWTTASIPELETARSAVKPEDGGAVLAPAGIWAIHAFLSRHSSTRVETTESGGTTVVRTPGDVLVKLLPLEHR